MEPKTIAVRRWWYIMPIAFITYSLAYLDRANFGFAAAAGMAKDLEITPAMSSLLGALFFHEWTHGWQFGFGICALVVIIVGVACTAFQEKSEDKGPSNLKRGLLITLISSLLYTSYAAAGKFFSVSSWDMLFPQAVFMVLGTGGSLLVLAGMGPAQFLISQEQAQARQHIAGILQKRILPAEKAFQKRQGLVPIAPQKFIHKSEQILFHRPGKEVLQIGHIDGFPAVGHGDAQFLQLRKDIEQGNITPSLEQSPQIGHGPAGQTLALAFQIVRHIGHDRLFRHRFGSDDLSHGLQGLKESASRIDVALTVK